MAMLLSTPPATDELSQGSTALSTLNNAGLLNFTIRRTEKSLGSDELFWRSGPMLQGRAPSCVLASCAAFLAKHIFLVFLASAFSPTLFFSFWEKTESCYISQAGLKHPIPSMKMERGVMIL